jgi:hypothetical protein
MTLYIIRSIWAAEGGEGACNSGAIEIQIQTRKWAWQYVYVYGHGHSNRRAGFQIWKVFGLNLYFDGTRAYTAVARSFAAFGGSYAPATTYAHSEIICSLEVHVASKIRSKEVHVVAHFTIVATKVKGWG